MKCFGIAGGSTANRNTLHLFEFRFLLVLCFLMNSITQKVFGVSSLAAFFGLGLKTKNSMPSSTRRRLSKNLNDNVRTLWMNFISVIIGILIGTSFPLYQRSKSTASHVPNGAERLPPKIIESESDLYLRRLWGDPREDLPIKPRYLVTFTVGYEHRDNINRCMQKFSENFTVVLFHYDGLMSEWDEFDWFERAVHVSARKQTKWWFAKRFMHPNVVAPYEYIFVWDEDLGLENFDPEEYIKIAKKHELEISQPGVLSDNVLWPLTRRKENSEVHKSVEDEKECSGEKKKPYCAGFVEVMAPVFSRNAWRCVWSMLQNDLVHGWGLDFAFKKCVDAPNEQIGVVDAQWVRHLAYPSLEQQGESHNGRLPWRGVRDRCFMEWNMFKKRLATAEKEFGISTPFLRFRKKWSLYDARIVQDKK